MGFADVIEAGILRLLLNGETIANLAQNHDTPLTVLYGSLHTSSPAGGNQSTNEFTYDGYGRISISRSPGSPVWTVTAGDPTDAVNDGEHLFPLCTGGSGTATYLGIGTDETGTGTLYAVGAINGGSGIAISDQVRPRIPAESATVRLAVAA